MLKELLTAIRATLVLAILTGLLFPLSITAISQLLFPYTSNGSLVFHDGKLVGSEVLAQGFSRTEYFHPRPSAAGSGYSGEASGGTNLGPTSKKLIHGDESFKGIKTLAQEYRTLNYLRPNDSVPADAVTRSSSGLDPHISLENARLQVKRVALARKIPEKKLAKFMEESLEDRTLGVFGEPRINVLKLNMSIDRTSFEQIAGQ